MRNDFQYWIFSYENVYVLFCANHKKIEIDIDQIIFQNHKCRKRDKYKAEYLNWKLQGSITVLSKPNFSIFDIAQSAKFAAFGQDSFFFASCGHLEKIGWAKWVEKGSVISNSSLPSHC